MTITEALSLPEQVAVISLEAVVPVVAVALTEFEIAEYSAVEKEVEIVQWGALAAETKC
jgi:hypothetical protein